MSGFVNGAQKGQYKTNKACPYPLEFCEYVSELIYKPTVKYATRIQNGENLNTVDGTLIAMPVGPVVSLQAPPADHYLCHLPKHPGCKACMDCKVQCKHCRDHVKGRQKKLVDVTKTDKPEEYEFEKLDTPKVFGDLVTSDSIFAIKRNSTNPAKCN